MEGLKIHLGERNQDRENLREQKEALVEELRQDGSNVYYVRSDLPDFFRSTSSVRIEVERYPQWMREEAQRMVREEMKKEKEKESREAVINMDCINSRNRQITLMLFPPLRMQILDKLHVLEEEGYSY